MAISLTRRFAFPAGVVGTVAFVTIGPSFLLRMERRSYEESNGAFWRSHRWILERQRAMHEEELRQAAAHHAEIQQIGRSILRQLEDSRETLW